MSAHIAHDIPRLLSGEAGRDDVLVAAAHLRTCVDCQHELISAVVAHASLTSAARFAPEVVAPRQEEPGPPADDDSPEQPPELPDLSAVFAQVRREAAEPQRRARFGRLTAAAAVAVVVAGGGTAIYLATSGSSEGTHARSITLAAYGKGTAPATASIEHGNRISIDAASLPQVAGERYEVWLTDSGRTRMQPVGWLGANGKAAMTIPTDLLEHFTDIEVSVQRIDASSYDYSGTSVLRGGYA